MPENVDRGSNDFFKLFIFYIFRVIRWYFELKINLLIFIKKIEVIWDENKSRMSKNLYRNFSNTFGDEIV